MAIGRISGPLLKANLLRQGVDLAFETDLLYLNVNDARIGVNTSSPEFDLDVNGSTRTTNLIVDTQLDVGVLTFVDNTISSSTNQISFLSPTGNEATVYHAKLIVDDFQITGNTISTEVSNSPIEIRPSGTGTVELQANTNITGDLYVSGKIDADGSVTIGGNIIIGDNLFEDVITVNAKIDSNLVPNADELYDIGTPTKRWRNVYISNLEVSQTLDIGNFSFEGNTISTSSTSIIFDTPEGESVVFNSKIVVDAIQIQGNVISTEVPDSPLELRPSGSGTIELESDTNVTGDLDVSNDLTVGNNATVNGNFTIGTDSSNTVTINSTLTGDLIPSQTLTYDIGSNSFRWKDIYAGSFDIATSLDVGDINFVNSTISTTENSIVFDTPQGEAVVFNAIIRVDDLQFTGNVISTEVSNSPVEIRPSGTGTIELQATTNVTGDLDVSDDLTVNGNAFIDGDVTLGTDGNNIITVNSKLQGDILPSDDNTYDIGASADRWKDIYSDKFFITTELDIGDVNFTSNVISTTTSSITFTTPNSAATVFNSRIVVDDIQIQGNVISTEVSNSNLDLIPDGTGKVKLKSDTEIDGDLHVTGNISASGSITIGGDIIIGDESTDTVTINARIESDLIPAEDVTYAIGDPQRRWKDIHVETVNASFINVLDLQIGDLQFSTNTVSTSAGIDINLNAGGAVNLGNFRINQNNITNVVSGAISVFEQIGTGYFKIATTNGFVPPVGNIGNRPTAYAVVGMTRYNTDLGALEIWNGAAWTSPAGPLSGITEAQANDIAASFALILG